MGGLLDQLQQIGSTGNNNQIQLIQIKLTDTISATVLSLMYLNRLIPLHFNQSQLSDFPQLHFLALPKHSV